MRPVPREIAFSPLSANANLAALKTSGRVASQSQRGFYLGAYQDLTLIPHRYVALLKQRVTAKYAGGHRHMGEVAAFDLGARGPRLDVCGTKELLGKLATTERAGTCRIWEEVPPQSLLLYAALSGGDKVEWTFC